jgi:hypothetical protein
VSPSIVLCGAGLALSLLVSSPVRAEGPTCEMCHRESATPPDPEGLDCNCSFFCKEKYFAKPEGMHGNMPCATCHPASRYGSFPHQGEVAPVNCTMCHPKQTQALEATVHNGAKLRAVELEMEQPLVREEWSTCLSCHPPHAGKGYAQPAYGQVNRRSRPCLACHVDERSSAPQVYGYEHPLHVFDAEGGRWGALTGLPLFDEHGRVVADGESGALTCNSCHSNHGPDAGPEHLRRPGWQKACASCHGADSLALYRYFHRPERRSHIVVPKEIPEEGASVAGPCGATPAPAAPPEAEAEEPAKE